MSFDTFKGHKCHILRFVKARAPSYKSLGITSIRHFMKRQDFMKSEKWLNRVDVVELLCARSIWRKVVQLFYTIYLIFKDILVTSQMFQFPKGKAVCPSRSACPPPHCSLRHLKKHNLTFGKLPLGKLHIWELATWEIVNWEVALGKMPLGKYLTSLMSGGTRYSWRTYLWLWYTLWSRGTWRREKEGRWEEERRRTGN